MINVIAIHLEPNGLVGLKHIAELKWVETASAGDAAENTAASVWSRAEFYKFVKEHPRVAYALNSTGTQYAFLEAVDDGHVQYVKTVPDSTTSDNLLSLPRY